MTGQYGNDVIEMSNPSSPTTYCSSWSYEPTRDITAPSPTLPTQETIWGSLRYDRRAVKLSPPHTPNLQHGMINHPAMFFTLVIPNAKRCCSHQYYQSQVNCTPPLTLSNLQDGASPSCYRWCWCHKSSLSSSRNPKTDLPLFPSIFFPILKSNHLNNWSILFPI